MRACLCSPRSQLAVFFAFGLAAAGLLGAERGETDAGLTETNRRLQEQVQAQQRTIDALSAQLAEVMRATERQERALKQLQQQVETSAPAAATVSDRARDVHVAGEAGLAFFSSGRDGEFPNSEFRVDDPVVSVEAPVWKDTYFFGELKLLTRETNSENFQLGELYVDFEDVSRWWGRPRLLSFRAGRINTPFGEEYQRRGPVANPLISHSLSDIWGTDEGAEIYGSIGPARYVLAVQNGGVSRLHDFNADKAVVARVGWEAASWLRLSGSAMRTGKLATWGDTLSDVWFGNGFFRSIGSTSETTAYWADLLEADATAHWSTGHASAALGGAWYDDNDRTANNRRRLTFGYVELVQQMADRLYGAARYSEIRAPKGYPLTGAGEPGEYFFRPSVTEELRRVSLGLGYRFGPPVVWKVEYSWNTGRLSGGEPRNGENFFGSEIGLKF